MRDLLETLATWRKQNLSIALATVIKTWGSAPRRTGAKMAVTADGKFIGSVSGGCVEGAVIEAATETVATKRPQLLEFGVADETAWSVGLACGGQIEVFVEPLSDAYLERVEAWLLDRGGAAATVIKGAEALLGRKLYFSGGTVSGSIAPEIDGAAATAAKEALAARRPQTVDLTDAGITLFVDVLLPPPLLVIVGGGHISIALARIAKLLNFQITIIEPRRAFAAAERLPPVDNVIQAWPQKAFRQLTVTPNTAVAVLTHDPKIDDPALAAALSSPAFYIGALGSSRTAARRRERLSQKGLTDEMLDRIRGPIGLDIRAQTPEEIALAVMAEIIQVYRTGEEK